MLWLPHDRRPHSPFGETDYGGFHDIANSEGALVLIADGKGRVLLGGRPAQLPGRPYAPRRDQRLSGSRKCLAVREPDREFRGGHSVHPAGRKQAAAPAYGTARITMSPAGAAPASAHAARRRVTVAARGSQRLMVGFRAGIAIAPAVQLFATRHPDVLVDVQRIEWDDQAPMLLDGRIDIGYVRLPIDEAGLRVAPLYAEPRVAVLPVGHRLAGKEEVTEADLSGEPLVWHADPSTQPTRHRHPSAGYVARGVDETLEHVAAGRGISFLARSATVFYSHPDVIYVPVPDLAPDQVCLAVAASRISPVVDDFFTAAQGAAEITAECGNYEMWQRGADAAAKHG